MKTKLCLAGAIILGYLSSIAFGQPPQPGDVPAPVVKGPDVFEVGLDAELTALITGPTTARAGAIIAFDVSGSSDVGQQLVFRPSVADDTIVWDTAPKWDPDAPALVYATIAKPGHYWAFWSVETQHAAAVALWEFDVVAGPPPDDPDDPPPGDAEFLAYVKALTEKVEAENHRDISAIFRGLAARIDKGELRASLAIQQATLRAVFGPPPEVMNPEWKPWFADLFAYLLNVKRLATPKDWARYYRLVARGVSDD